MMERLDKLGKGRKRGREINARQSIIVVSCPLSEIICASSRSARQETQFRDINVRAYLLRDSRVYVCAVRHARIDSLYGHKAIRVSIARIDFK